MVKIKSISRPTHDENGVIISAGRVGLTNCVDVWFSDIMEIKTLDEALEVTHAILNALNS